MRRRIIFGVILVLVLVSAARLVRMRKGQLMGQRVSPVATVPVKTGQVSLGDFSGEQVCYGVITSERQAVVRSRTGGEVSHILAREGDVVVKGDPLAELDGTAYAPLASRAAISTVVSNLERSVEGLRLTRKNLKATLDNDRMLRQNDAISQQQVDMSENRYEEAGVQLLAVRSELAGQRAQLAHFTVKAPFDGVVGDVQVQVGDVAAPMQSLFRIEDPSPCKIVATVSSRDLPRIQPGGAVTLVSNGKYQRAEIGRIHPSVGSTGTGSVDVFVDNPPFGLSLGSSVEVRLAVDVLPRVLMVPATAVLEGVQVSRVHVVQDDTVRVVPVRILAASGEVVAVRGDLSPTDRLVLGSDSLLMRLANGVHVSAQGDYR